MHQPTNRVLNILESVAKTGMGKRLADFSKELGIPKSTLLPILRTLCDHGYLSQTPGGAYEAGVSLYSLGTSLLDHFSVMDFVRGQLQILVDTFGETCYFGVLEEGYVRYLDKVDSTHPLRMLIELGRRLPAYATGIGKALLMDFTEEALHATYSQGLTALTEKTVTSLSALWDQLCRARDAGYAQETEESTEHIRCFAVPVRKNGSIVAAVSMAIPVFRYDADQQPSVVEALQKAAMQIGKVAEDTDSRFGNGF